MTAGRQGNPAAGGFGTPRREREPLLWVALAVAGAAVVGVAALLALRTGTLSDGPGTFSDGIENPGAGARVQTAVIAAEDPMEFHPHVPVADRRTPRSPHGPELAGACAACHGEIAEEWSRGQHALAWIDEHFQASLEGLRRPQACYGCHVPEPLHGAGRRFGSTPYARDPAQEPWHFGISCATCHLGPDGVTWLGPSADAIAPHPVAQGESFVGVGSNRLCIDCHRTDVGPVLGIAQEYERSDLAARGVSCLDCHFAPTERASAPGARVRVGRSHELLGPRDPLFLAQAFAPRALVAGDEVAVVLENRAGHRVPGLVGRVLSFEAQVEDRRGATLARAAFTLGAENALALGEAREHRIPLDDPSAAARVRLRGEHLAPGWDRPVPFLDILLPLSP